MMVIGAMIVISEIDNLLRTFMPPNHYWSKIFESIYPSGQAGIWKFFLVAAILAPFVEETIFRGVILKGFVKHYRPHRAIIASAILFGLIHLNPWQFWGGVIWGCIAGWWFYKTSSLIPCIIGHLLLNSTPLFASDLLKLKITGFTVNCHPVQYQPLWFDLLGVGLLALGIMILAKLFRYNRKF